MTAGEWITKLQEFPSHFEIGQAVKAENILGADSVEPIVTIRTFAIGEKGQEWLVCLETMNGNQVKVSQSV